MRSAARPCGSGRGRHRNYSRAAGARCVLLARAIPCRRHSRRPFHRPREQPCGCRRLKPGQYGHRRVLRRGPGEPPPARDGNGTRIVNPAGFRNVLGAGLGLLRATEHNRGTQLAVWAYLITFKLGGGCTSPAECLRSTPMRSGKQCETRHRHAQRTVSNRLANGSPRAR